MKNSSSHSEEVVVIPFDLDIPWDTGAPEVKLFSTEYKTILCYYNFDDAYNENGDISISERTVLIEFDRCILHKFGSPNDETLGGHPLYKKGLKFYSAHVVRNSNWIEEIKNISKIHDRYLPGMYDDMKHYIFCFKDSTYECIAENFSFEVLTCSVKEVFLKIYDIMYGGNEI